MNENQKGFASSIIIGVIVVAAIILVGALVYNQHNKTKITNSSSTTPSTSTSNAKPTNPYAGWKVYESSVAGYSIKYPENWTVRTSTNNGGAEDTRIDGPGFPDSKYFEINILSFSKSSAYWRQPGSSEKCTAWCKTINKSSQVSISGYGALYVDATTGEAGGGTINQLLLFPSVDNTLIASPVKAGLFTSFNGIFQGMSQQQQTNMTPAQFLASSDVKTAISIYKSLSY